MRIGVALLRGAALFWWAWGAGALAQDRLVVFPFENRSHLADYNWIRETVGEVVRETLDREGGEVVTRHQRDRALQRLGLAPEDLLTRAAMLRLSADLGANLALIGEYDLSGASPDGAGERGSVTVSLMARLVDVTAGSLIAHRALHVSGPLEELQEMEARIARDLLSRRPGMLEGMPKSVPPSLSPPAAWQSLMKALQTSDLRQREGYLRHAIQASVVDGRPVFYPQAVYQLGLLALELGDEGEGSRQLALLRPEDQLYREGQFQLGIAAYRLGDYQRMVETLTALATSWARPEIWNNLGVGLLAGQEERSAWEAIQLALADHPEDPDLQFNAGYAQWRLGLFEGALPSLQRVVEARPGDGQALYLLAKCLQSLGRVAEAALVDDRARRALPSYARWEVRPASIPPLGRLKLELDPWEAPLLHVASPADIPAPSLTGSSPFEVIRTLVDRDQDGAAWREVERLLELEPRRGESHLWHGLLLARRGEEPAAHQALQTALRLDPELVEAHLALARLFLGKRDRAQALVHTSQALSLDPRNRAARSLQRQIEVGQ